MGRRISKGQTKSVKALLSGERGVASPCLKLKQKKPAVSAPGKFGRISGDGKEETKGREGRGIQEKLRRGVSGVRKAMSISIINLCNVPVQERFGSCIGRFLAPAVMYRFGSTRFGPGAVRSDLILKGLRLRFLNRFYASLYIPIWGIYLYGVYSFISIIYIYIDILYIYNIHIYIYIFPHHLAGRNGLDRWEERVQVGRARLRW